MNILALIPARGGSKGIKQKNLYPVQGKPLIQYTLDTVLLSDCIDKIVVSSDCDEILNFASNFNGVESLKRPDYLATDAASSIDVLKHAIEVYSNQDFTHVLYMEPTAPLRSLRLIQTVVSKLDERKAVMTVVEEDGIYGFIRNDAFIPLVEGEARRRQEREPKFKECSVLYGLEIEYFNQNMKIADPEALPVVISKTEALDINDLNDIEFFEYLLSKNKKIKS